MHRTAPSPHTTGRVLHGARWYDLFSTIISLGQDRAIRAKLVDLAAPASGEQVLDVGCGTGTLARAIEPRVGAGQVHGIDASAEMIQYAREKAASRGAVIDFQVAVIEALPFPTASLDLVTSSLMLHHLPDDLKDKGFLEIRRVLKPGGRFAALDFAGHSHSPIGHILAIFGHHSGAVATAHAGMADDLLPRLRRAGFDDVEVVPTTHKSFVFILAR